MKEEEWIELHKYCPDFVILHRDETRCKHEKGGLWCSYETCPKIKK